MRVKNDYKNDLLIKDVADDCVNHWYSEEKNYNYKSPEDDKNKLVASHFTQLVWSSSEAMGSGLTYYQHHSDVIFHCVALYFSRGNTANNYGRNVLCKLSDSTCKTV